MKSETATQVKSVPKSLPMKHKCLMYGAIAMWESLKSKGLVCESNFMDVVHLDVGEQIAFLDEMIDVNFLEKEIVKPMQKARKKEISDANKPVKEKKPRAKKANVEKSEIILDAPIVKATEELVPELAYVPTPIVTVTVTPTVDVAVVETEKKKPKPKVRKAVEENGEAKPEKKVRKTKTKTIVVMAEVDPPDYWMVYLDYNKYWTTDEDLKNGELFANARDDEGDSCPGVVVGKLVDGQMVRL